MEPLIDSTSPRRHILLPGMVPRGGEGGFPDCPAWSGGGEGGFPILIHDRHPLVHYYQGASPPRL